MRTLGFLLGMTAWISSVEAADHFPLQQGNVWVYRHTGTNEPITMSVGTPVLMNQRVYYPLRGYTPQQLLVRLNDRKELVQVDDGTGLEQVVTSFVPLQGGWWDAPSRGCREMAQTFDKGATHDGPAGPFREVLEIYYQPISCADIGSELEQYAANIGMVRRVVTTIAGPQTYDLIYARVSSMQIEATPNAAFSVSFERFWPSSYTALLRLRTNAQRPVTLHFPSGQEFEVLLRDEAGNVIWRWSDGKVFAMGEHTLTVDGEWAVPVQIPDGLLPRGGPQPERYTLQAWLVTEAAAPSFAATLPLTLPAKDVR